MTDTKASDDVSLKNFEHLDNVGDAAAYVHALEVFDAQREIQELKAIALERTDVTAGRSVLDVGCGFGLETLRLAKRVGPTGSVTGLDSSAVFLAEARRRAAAAGLSIDFRQGDAAQLPFQDGSFDIGRAERLLIYLDDPGAAVSELKRVVRPGGSIALIEPDFETNAINVPDRALTRRILQRECDFGVRQGWLVRSLKGMLEDKGFEQIQIATRVVLYDPDLAAGYFTRLGDNARQAKIIDDGELAAWTEAIAERHEKRRLFCSIGYYLFTATV
jgi:ubiquinone/menaquinone biosynthesis C-methylase UbiE